MFMRVLIAVVLLLALQSATLAQIGSGMYADSANHFQLKPAPQWMKASPDVVGLIDEMQDFDNPYRTSSVTMAWQRSTSDKVVYPWVMVEVTSVDLSGWSLSDIEQAFDAPTKPEKAAALGKPLLQMAPALAADEMVLDRQRLRIIEKYEGTDEENIPYTAIVVGFLGKSGVVHVGFVGDSRQLDYYLPEFQKFVDGFRWDKGYEYVAPTGAGAGTGGWTANRSEAQVAAAEAKDQKASSRGSNRGGTSIRLGRRGVFGGVGLVGAIIGFIIWRWMDR